MRRVFVLLALLIAAVTVPIALIMRPERRKIRECMGRELIRVAYAGDTAQATSLMLYGVDVNYRDRAGWTALHWAAAKDRPKVVKMLLQAGADAGIRTEYGGSDEAAHFGPDDLEDAVKRQLEWSRNPGPPYRPIGGSTALDLARALRRPQVVEILDSESTRH
jgi:hypothetical protein